MVYYLGTKVVKKNESHKSKIAASEDFALAVTFLHQLRVETSSQ